MLQPMKLLHTAKEDERERMALLVGGRVDCDVSSVP